MRKLLSIFAFVLLYVGITFGQAAVNIPITVSDNAGFSAPIYFGLDLAATDGSDFALEGDPLPGVPLTGVPFAAWLYPDFTSLSYYDYRAPGATPPGSFPYSGHKSYTIRVQTDNLAGGNPMTVSWNLPSSIAATSTISAGSQVVSFSGTGSIVFNYNPSPIPSQNLIFVFVEVDFVNAGPVTPQPIFGVSPASLNFGNVNVGGNATDIVTVSNTGVLPLVVTDIVPSDGQYTVTSPVSFTILAGGPSVPVSVRFAPTSAGTKNANLTFTHNAPIAGTTTNYAVTGVGAAPVFGLSVASLPFGIVAVGGSAMLPVTVNNTGLAPLSITGLSSSNGQFTFSPAIGSSLIIAAGGNQVFNVTFTPTLPGGLVNANLTFTHNGPGPTTVLPLSGTGRTQGGNLEFEVGIRERLDGTTNNLETVHLRNYSGQNLKALQFKMILGKNGLLGQGKLIFRSVSRGGSIPTPAFNFSYELKSGTLQADGSSQDTLKVVILGNGINSIPPGADYELMKFSYDIVDLTVPTYQTYIGFTNVIGSTETPVADAVIGVSGDQIINIGNGTSQGLLGDVNLDQQVNILDILEMIDYILERTPSWTAQQIYQGDISPWTTGALLPTRDGVINVLDLAVLQEIVRTGFYPSGVPVYKAPRWRSGHLPLVRDKCLQK